MSTNSSDKVDEMRARAARALESLANYLRSGRLHLNQDVRISVDYDEWSAHITIEFDMLDGYQLDAIRNAMDGAGFKRFFVHGGSVTFSS